MGQVQALDFCRHGAQCRDHICFICPVSYTHLIALLNEINEVKGNFIDNETANQLTPELKAVWDEIFVCKNENKVYSRESLLKIVWGEDYPGDVRTVDVLSLIHIFRQAPLPVRS